MTYWILLPHLPASIITSPMPTAGHKMAALMVVIIIIIIMYIYHVQINTLSTHMIHINLNMVYTRTAQSYQNNLHKVIYTENKQTHELHTHNDCNRNWVLILVGMKIL